ncbi:GTPase Era, mitochondrial-like [Ptychodera flava]|uniref:GTPase Era, mitochondrial-like n=1 Tax=Ptychodera flava TaxID=63121 RepID=UPI003969BFDA
MAAAMLPRALICWRRVFPSPVIYTRMPGPRRIPNRTYWVLRCLYHSDVYNATGPEPRTENPQKGHHHEIQPYQPYREPLKPMATNKAYHELLCLQIPDQPENAKVLRVAVIGSPNAGKSTLTNQLMGRWVSSVSSKVHTTRKRTIAVLTEGETQIIFLDTPGMVDPRKAKRHSLDKSMMSDPRNTIEEADLVLVMVDVSNKWTRYKLDTDVLLTLYSNPTVPSILVLNKIDMVKTKHMLLGLTAQLTEGIVGGQSFEVDDSTAKLLGSPSKKQHMSLNFVKKLNYLEQKLKKDSERKLQMADLNVGDVAREKLATVFKDWKKKQADKILREGRIEVADTVTAQKLARLWTENFPHKEVDSNIDESLSMGNSQVFTSRAVLPDGQHSHEGSVVDRGESVDQESNDNVSQQNESADHELHDEVSLDELQKFLSRDDIDEILDLNLDEEILKSKLRGVSLKDIRWIRHRLRAEQTKRLKRQIRKKNGWPKFEAVFMLSALDGEGADDLQDYLFANAKPGDWEYHPDMVTNQSPEEVIHEVIRGKLLEYLPEEVPYQLQQSTELFEKNENGDLHISQKIVCKKRSHARMLVASKGRKIIRITNEAAEDLMNAFQCNVQLYLDVKYEK